MKVSLATAVGPFFTGKKNGGISLTIRHNEGTNFSFADGHSEYFKWKDKRTIELSFWDRDEYMFLYFRNWFDPGSPEQPNNPDLQKVQRAVWGKLGYIPVQ